MPTFDQMKGVYDAGTELKGKWDERPGAKQEGKVQGCWLKTSARGWGHPPSFSTGQCTDPNYEKATLFCYPKCAEGARGVGPVCWGYCPTGTHQCGVLCQGENETCLSKIGKMTMESLATVGFVAA